MVGIVYNLKSSPIKFVVYNQQHNYSIDYRRVGTRYLFIVFVGVQYCW